MNMNCVLLMMMATLSQPALADALEGKRAPAEIIAAADADQWRDVDPAQLLVFDLEQGRVSVELSDHFAPNHVAQVKTLVKGGFYDGLSFYRVIDGFVAQGGDPFEQRALPQGTVKALKAENTQPYADKFDSLLRLNDFYTDEVMFVDGAPAGIGEPQEAASTERVMFALHCSGAFAFGRNNDPDSGSTEFYITLQPQRYLDRNLTVFGRVIDGMEHVQALTRQTPPDSEDDPVGDVIVRAWMGDHPPEGVVTPGWQILRTDTQTFAEYVESRRNRPEDFFIYRPNHVDICQLSIPIRQGVAE